jgi:Uma2 family endonuclease
MTHLIGISPLLFEPGDRMSCDEFLERWERMPDVKFAELIDGIVYMPSPLSYDHSRCDGLLQWLFGTYAASSGVCQVLPNATWLMLESVPQPDVALRLLPEFGGRTRTSGVLCSGAPELVVEIARSSRSY